MRRVTLNFASEARAGRAIALARALASIAEEPPAVGQPRPLATEADIAYRIESATDALSSARPEIVCQVDAFIARVESLETRLAARHVTLAEVQISPQIRHGAYFIAREGALAAVALPIALLGRVTHWLPLRLARALALRPLALRPLALGSLASDPSRDQPSRDQPAMRTIVLGLTLVLLWYGLQGGLVAHWFGGAAALLWTTAIFLAARVDFLLRDRLHRGWRRARTYLAIRADPALREGALVAIQALLAEALALEQALTAATVGILP
jgi:hypothetical protein